MMQPMAMMPQQQMMPQMMMQQQPMMMMPQPQMMMMPQQQMMQPTSTTGAKAAELIEAQLHPPTVTESSAVPVSILDVAPEVKPAESSSASSESSGGSSEGKRVIKLS